MIASLLSRVAALRTTRALQPDDCEVCADLAGRGILLHDLTIRNLFVRIDPLVTINENGAITAPARDIVDVLEGRLGSLHRRTPNQIAAAPLRDHLAVIRLRALARTRLAGDESATLTLHVPEAIAGWIRLRYARADRMMADLSRVA